MVAVAMGVRYTIAAVAALAVLGANAVPWSGMEKENEFGFSQIDNKVYPWGAHWDTADDGYNYNEDGWVRWFPGAPDNTVNLEQQPEVRGSFNTDGNPRPDTRLRVAGHLNIEETGRGWVANLIFGGAGNREGDIRYTVDYISVDSLHIPGTRYQLAVHNGSETFGDDSFLRLAIPFEIRDPGKYNATFDARITARHHEPFGQASAYTVDRSISHNDAEGNPQVATLRFTVSPEHSHWIQGLDAVVELKVEVVGLSGVQKVEVTNLRSHYGELSQNDAMSLTLDTVGQESKSSVVLSPESGSVVDFRPTVRVHYADGTTLSTEIVDSKLGGSYSILPQEQELNLGAISGTYPILQRDTSKQTYEAMLTASSILTGIAGVVAIAAFSTTKHGRLAGILAAVSFVALAAAVPLFHLAAKGMLTDVFPSLYQYQWGIGVIALGLAALAATSIMGFLASASPTPNPVGAPSRPQPGAKKRTCPRCATIVFVSPGHKPHCQACGFGG